MSVPTNGSHFFVRGAIYQVVRAAGGRVSLSLVDDPNDNDAASELEFSQAEWDRMLGSGEIIDA